MDAPMIWIISPDPDTRRLIGLNLSKRGFRTLEAFSQDELAAADATPQLIILDELDWEAIGALRRDSRAQGVPMILLLPTAPTARRLAPLQPVRWLEKPLAMDALLVLVRRCLVQGEM